MKPGYNEVIDKFREATGYTMTGDQEKAMEGLVSFLFGHESQILILNGYAGTGKTTILKALVKVLEHYKTRFLLMAPTGRAAKVLSSYCGAEAYTIHKAIYRQKVSSEAASSFSLGYNPNQDAIFIVDEVSMLSNISVEDSVFGTGCLLDDLIQFCFSKDGCKLVLSGDQAQLPPVGTLQSPALDLQFMQGYGYPVTYLELSEVVRQEGGSGILINANAIRQKLDEPEFEPPLLDTARFSDVARIAGTELIDALTRSYDTVGMEETVVICRSNKLANKYNQGIRNAVLYREEELVPGDLLMVVKNNYHWLGENKIEGFIANGDVAKIQRIHKYEEIYGLRFCEASVELPHLGYEDLRVKLLLNSLTADGPSISRELQDKFYKEVSEDYSHITSGKKRFEEIRKNPWFNALHVKYAYAVTCHKAQGGQWNTVFIDQGFIKENGYDADYLRWLYTAFTRPYGNLFLVNFPDILFA